MHNNVLFYKENRVATLDDIFEVSVTLDLSGQNAHPNARLLGNTSVMFTNVSCYSITTMYFNTSLNPNARLQTF